MRFTKWLLPTYILLLFVSLPSAGQLPNDSIIKEMTIIKDTINSGNNNAQVTNKRKIYAATDSCTTKATLGGCKKIVTLDILQWFLIYLPLLLFLILSGFFISLIIRGKFDLAEALSTGQLKTHVKTTDSEGIITETNKSAGSTSRLIAFLTGITALIVAISLLTLVSYYTVAGCCGTPPFDGLWKILAGLGIGVIPYGVNVWKGNAKEIDPQNNNT